MAFNNAHNFGIGTANINIFQNHHAPLPTDPAEILRQARAVEASHTSVTVGYVSKCHPTTREEVIADITDWVVGDAGANQGTAPRRSILWFSGPAGGGKTSIMRNVVDRCGATGFLTLSYFFSTRGSGVTSERPFVATIVYQLTILHPALRPVILDIIRGQPTIFEESLDFQMDTLLVQPLQSPAFRAQSSPRKIVIALDGLDECREDREREHVLDILHSLVTQLPRLIVIVVASRPEFDLRRAFNHPKLSNVTKFLKLQEYDGTKDIWVFLCDEFEVIRQSHPLRELIPEGWPLEGIVQLLVDKSSGNFILPVTVMKHLKNSRRSPVDSLKSILGLFENPSPTSNPLAELDALYNLILHSPDTDSALVKRILHCILGVTAALNPSFLSSSFLDDFLGLPPGTTATTLCDLHSILSIPESKNWHIKFHHKSMEDYLLNPERSSDFFQSPYETHLDIATLCATYLTRWSNNPVVDHSDYIFYSAGYWDDHLRYCINHKPMSESATLPDIITDLDPRIAVLYRFMHGFNVATIGNDTLKAFHTASCTRLCRLAIRINKCMNKLDAFNLLFDRGDFEGRLGALPRYKSETGLYAPLDLDSFENEDEDGEPDDGLAADTMDGRSLLVLTASLPGASSRALIAIRDGLGRPSNSPSRRESLDAEASSSTSLLPPPAPTNLVPRSSLGHRFMDRIKRPFRGARH